MFTYADRVRQRLNRAKAERLFEQALKDQNAGTLRRGEMYFLPAKVLSILILSVPLVCFCAGLASLIAAYYEWGMLFPAAFFLMAARVMAPRRPSFANDAQPISNFPLLASRLKEIADAVGCEAPDLIVFDGEINASMLTIGRRGQLTIGFILWDGCTAKERTALLAHELAHLANNNPARGRLFGAALDSLAAWHMLLTPDVGYNFDGSRAYGGLGMQLSELILWMLRLPVSAVYRLLLGLLYVQSQRAEYFADAISVRVAGVSAARSLLSKIVLAPLSLQERNFLFRAKAVRLAEALPAPLISPDPVKAAALMAEMQEEESSVDTTHPPTVFRLRFISALYAYAGELPSVSYEKIDDELSQVRLRSYQKLASQIESEQEMGVRYG
ncbi:M48 family metallopeptidase [Halocynthiibacter styelae]|uniref:M48 family metalloprotease n=1 Tax=Halocynthiibacter styelae TaxID=2761955 RepID=A0A8J7ITG6_9RHOB|nr:M48 family metallopeptidase [Paenihalocynthiibacter styelae]MBI1492739.1 M48 family metalloprotease [Paenihalocynthiibacter styelae]